MKAEGGFGWLEIDSLISLQNVNERTRNVALKTNSIFILKPPSQNSSITEYTVFRFYLNQFEIFLWCTNKTENCLQFKILNGNSWSVCASLAGTVWAEVMAIPVKPSEMNNKTLANNASCNYEGGNYRQVLLFNANNNALSHFYGWLVTPAVRETEYRGVLQMMAVN